MEFKIGFAYFLFYYPIAKFINIRAQSMNEQLQSNFANFQPIQIINLFAQVPTHLFLLTVEIV